MSRLYIIDDDLAICNLLKTITSSLFDKIELFDSGKAFLQESISLDDIVILDLMMPNFDGIEVIRFLAKNELFPKLILISGYDQGVLNSSQRLAADYGFDVLDIFTKPIAMGRLTNVLTTFNTKTIESSVNDNETKSKKYNALAEFNPSIKDIELGIKKHQFILYFQPQVSTKTNELVGVEALVRWQHPIHGLVFPDKFIPLAEKTGVIESLTNEVLDLAIQQCCRWKTQELLIKTSINLSGKNISSLQVPEQLRNLVRSNQLDPSMIVLEVTESALMGNLTQSLDILTRLRLKGFHLSIDDFGTGFSSLSQLHKVPFTELKIDQSFVKYMVEDPECFAIVETCVMLGHKLNMDVVAEGVETKEALTLLTQMGCDIAQGYFIARPMAAEAFMSWQQNRLSIINKVVS